MTSEIEEAVARVEPPMRRHAEIVDFLWQNLLDVEDRTSPAEYPDMALITRDELSDYIAEAMAEASFQAQHLLTASQAEVERLTRERDDFNADTIRLVNEKTDMLERMVVAEARATRAEALVEEAKKKLEASVGAHTKLLREWMYAPFPKEAQVLGGMSPPKGPFADAAASIEVARAFLDKMKGEGQ